MRRSLKPPFSSKALPWASIWLLSMCDVLSPASGGLGHLVILAALRVVEFFARLPVIKGEEAAAEAEGFDFDDCGEGEGVELAEASVFVEEVGHWRGGSGGGGLDFVDGVDSIDGPVIVNPVIPVTSGLPRASPPLLSPRMRTVIRLAEPLLGDMGVDLGRRKGSVA